MAARSRPPDRDAWDGTEFWVWAPRAELVEVVVHKEKTALEEVSDGWHSGFVSSAVPGDDYAFSLDRGKRMPDPRSPWQPDGVHGPSRLLDHSVFEWHDEGWTNRPIHSALLYELHVGTFTPEGTFAAAIERLGHLVELGVNTIELMPVAQFSGARGWGYDGVDLYAPHSAYGGPDGLKSLVDACHQRGLAVVLDVVYNHLGPEGNYLGQFGPYFTDRYRTPWGDAVNFDGPGSRQVRDFFVDNALMWLRDYHMDGLRLDAVHAIYDFSAVHFLEELSQRVETLEAQLGRDLWLIAESDLNDPKIVRGRDAHGYGIDAQWSDDFHHALHAIITEERSGYYEDFGRVEHLARALRDAYVYAGTRSPHRNRVHGRPADGLGGHRFLAYSQNHDQVGNRARGERTSALVEPEALKVAAAAVLVSPFVPMLFQGEEWGASSPFLYFTDHKDEGLGDAVRNGRRNEFAAFGWDPEEIPDPQSLDTFEWSVLSWEEVEDPAHADLLDWYRRLIQLRRSSPALSDGRRDLVETDVDEDRRSLVVRRGPITAAFNFSSERVTIPIPGARRAALVLASSDPFESDDAIQLPPTSVAIWSR